MNRKTPVFYDVDSFAEKVKKYMDFVKSVSKREQKFDVRVSSGVDSSGRRILYRMYAHANDNGCNFARYEDQTPRVHDVEGGEKFRLDEETKEFGDEVVESLEKRGIHTSVSDLEISIS